MCLIYTVFVKKHCNFEQDWMSRTAAKKRQNISSVTEDTRKQFLSLAEHMSKCLKVEYLGRLIYNFEKSRYTYPLDYKDSASTKK
jgi:hypothetical protein